jgi:hypothetical protein
MATRWRVSERETGITFDLTPAAVTVDGGTEAPPYNLML